MLAGTCVPWCWLLIGQEWRAEFRCSSGFPINSLFLFSVLSLLSFIYATTIHPHIKTIFRMGGIGVYSLDASKLRGGCLHVRVFFCWKWRLQCIWTILNVYRHPHDNPCISYLFACWVSFHGIVCWLFKKNLSGTLSECQTVWFQTLIWVQTVCRGYQQTANVAPSKERVKWSFVQLYKTCFNGLKNKENKKIYRYLYSLIYVSTSLEGCLGLVFELSIVIESFKI